MASPQVTREPRGKSEKARESALRVSRFLNHLVLAWRPQISEMFKNGGLRGEFIGQINTTRIMTTNYVTASPSCSPPRPFECLLLPFTSRTYLFREGGQVLQHENHGREGTVSELERQIRLGKYGIPRLF